MMRSMCALTVCSIQAFKEQSALARITCSPTALGRECARAHTQLCGVVVVCLSVRLWRTLHCREVDRDGACSCDTLVQQLQGFV
jgi:hypothetical protein